MTDKPTLPAAVHDNIRRVMMGASEFEMQADCEHCHCESRLPAFTVVGCAPHTLKVCCKCGHERVVGGEWTGKA